MSKLKLNCNIMREFSRWWLNSTTRAFVFVFVLTIIMPFACTDDAHLLQSAQNGDKFHVCHINISSKDKTTKQDKFFRKIEGKCGKNSVISTVHGRVMQAQSNKTNKEANNNYGCSHYDNPKFPTEQWIALVQRGECSFTSKIRIATKEHNASAIVIYNDSDDNKIIMNLDKGIQSISVLISNSDGKDIVGLLNDHHEVYIQINLDSDDFNIVMQNSISKTSVLFVSISFIVLMIISLAWLVFYYIQRFRYSHAKERLARRLVCAAKKAIAKIPQRTVKAGDKELDSEFDQCAVCIEPYKAHDVIRILPCRHVFHKSCVDPWLLDQRSCPMCKLDILRAFGMQIGGSQESVHHDAEAGPVAPVVPEPEVSSSVEDAQTDEIKVLLVPHTCLHFRSGCDKVAGDDEEASSSLLGAVGGAVPKSSSSCSLNSKGSRYSRAEKSDKDESLSSEIKLLIGKGKGRKERWQSKEECNDEDDECNIGENAFRDNDEHMVNVVETLMNNQEMNSEQEDEVECLDSSSKLSFPPPPTPLSLSSEQLNTEACTPSEESEPVMRNESVNKDSIAIIVNDDRIIQDTFVMVKFHEVDEADMEART